MVVPRISTRVGENENTKVDHVSQNQTKLKLVVKENMKGRMNIERVDRENMVLNMMADLSGAARRQMELL
jgi:hypothetical protein